MPIASISTADNAGQPGRTIVPPRLQQEQHHRQHAYELDVVVIDRPRPEDADIEECGRADDEKRKHRLCRRRRSGRCRRSR